MRRGSCASADCSVALRSLATKGDLLAEAPQGVTLERGQHRSVELVLHPGRRVTALVTDGDDETARVIPGADVALVEGGLSSFPLHGRTGTDGKVTLGPISAGPRHRARAPEFGPSRGDRAGETATRCACDRRGQLQARRGRAGWSGGRRFIEGIGTDSGLRCGNAELHASGRASSGRFRDGAVDSGRRARRHAWTRAAIRRWAIWDSAPAATSRYLLRPALRERAVGDAFRGRFTARRSLQESARVCGTGLVEGTATR